jgi:hypothetical protein
MSDTRNNSRRSIPNLVAPRRSVKRKAGEKCHFSAEDTTERERRSVCLAFHVFLSWRPKASGNSLGFIR